MKKLTTPLLLAILSVASIASADSRSQQSSPSDRISNFLAGGPGSALLQQTSAPSFSYTSGLQSDYHWGLWENNFSSLSGALTSFLDQHHFDPQSLNDLQSFINNLHLDPNFLSNLKMLAQNLHDCHFNCDWMDSHSDENCHNDNDHHDGHCDFGNGEPCSVPEPTTLVAFLTGAALLGGAMIRRVRRGK
jgi:hypothetical protein